MLGVLLFATLLLAAPSADRATEAAAVRGPPVSFIPNAGQTDGSVRYMARGRGYAFHFTPRKAVLDFQRGDRGVALELRFRGANLQPEIVAEGSTGARANYLVGSRHHTHLPAYAQLRYRDLWPGIDMIFRGGTAQLKYEFVVRPGADPRSIRLAYVGAESVALGRGGALLIETPLGTLRDQRPRSFQASGPIPSRYAVTGASFGFQVGAYDRSRALTIDPGLAYSTYLSGGFEDWAEALDVDTAGNAYVVGHTNSMDFPTTPGAYDPTDNQNTDAFVTKLSPSGGIVWSTLLGGNGGGDPEFGPFWGGEDSAMDVVVDGQGSTFVLGATDSIDFPTTSGAYREANPDGRLYGYVAKLTPDGSALAYSTLVGPQVSESWGAIDIDASGKPYIGGTSFASDYPTTPGAYRTAPGGGYITKLNATGTALEYSTYFHAPVYDLRVDDLGEAVFTGPAGSGLPTTPGAYDMTYNGTGDAYVTKLDSVGGDLVYSTYLGGGSEDQGNRIALDVAGNTYVTGPTRSSDFPTTPGAYSTAFLGTGFATKLNSTGSALVYSTFLDGNDFLSADGGIDVDAQGSAYITGTISDADLETTPDAHDATLNGEGDAYLVKLTPSGDAFAYATYLGGSARDWPFGLAVDEHQNAYLAGMTHSTDYPITSGAADGDGPGGDAFVTKIDLSPFTGYARPRGATPARFSLAIAYKECTDPNATHAPPLAFDSCVGPQMASDYLTVGTGDSNAMPARNDGYVRLVVRPGDLATPADEADVVVQLFSDDVFTKELADYAGELRATFDVRITDRDNTPLVGGSPEPATTVNVPLGVTFACAPTADSQEGASCSASTTFDALIPGAIKEGKRSIWQIERLRVFDGGADGDGDTTSDNTLFATQGVFIP